MAHNKVNQTVEFNDEFKMENQIGKMRDARAHVNQKPFGHC